MEVRLLLPELRKRGLSLCGRGTVPFFGRLGRQLADHRDLESRMLWVQLPPEALTRSSWSSLECSPPCQGGGHGFKSHRGRLTARYANRQSGQAQTLVIVCGFNSHPRYCVEEREWPVRLSARGHQPLKLEGWVRFPYGLIHDQVVEPVDTRRSERRALAGVGVRLSPWSPSH